MAEGTATLEAPAQGTQAATAPETKSALIAGKYADQAALEKGIREADKTLGFNSMPADKPLIGEGATYRDVDEAVRDYKRLDALISRTRQPKPESKPGETQAPLQIGGDQLPESATIPDILGRAGLKPDEVLKQWTDKGDLTDEQFKAIRAIRPGWSKADIRFVAEGLQAKAILTQQQVDKARTDAAAVVGGAEQLQTLLAQAKVFVPEADQAGFTAMLQNPATTVAAVKVLKQMHADHIGAGGSQPIVNGTQSGTAPTITTKAQYDELQRRVTMGDERAWEILKNVDVTTLKM